jgi:hypothetical protein
VRYGAQAKEILAKYYPFIGLGLAVLIVLFLVVKRLVKRREEDFSRNDATAQR